MNKPIPPSVGGVVVQNRQAVHSLAPLAGMTGQDCTPYASPWVSVPRGSYLALHLTLTNKVGTFVAYVETCNQMDLSGPVPVALDAPRVLGSFPQVAGPITVPNVQAFVGVPIADAWVRVVATPGQAAGQTCDWTVTGEAVAAAYARTP